MCGVNSTPWVALNNNSDDFLVRFFDFHLGYPVTIPVLAPDSFTASMGLLMIDGVHQDKKIQQLK